MYTILSINLEVSRYLYNYNFVLNYNLPWATVNTDLSVSYDSSSPTNQQKKYVMLFSGVPRTRIAHRK